jgi:hypothetical protein
MAEDRLNNRMSKWLLVAVVTLLAAACNSDTGVMGLPAAPTAKPIHAPALAPVKDEVSSQPNLTPENVVKGSSERKTRYAMAAS